MHACLLTPHRNSNLSGNNAICGTAPDGLIGLDATGTNLGTDCSAVTATTPPPEEETTAQDSTIPGDAVVETPAANTTDPVPAPAADNTTAAATASAPAPEPAPVAVPAPARAVIANAPICSCALRGFGSDDCAAALSNTCAQSSPPDVCTAGDPSVSEPAAEQLGQYLAQACFPGQDMDTSICNCAQVNPQHPFVIRDGGGVWEEGEGACVCASVAAGEGSGE